MGTVSVRGFQLSTYEREGVGLGGWCTNESSPQMDPSIATQPPHKTQSVSDTLTNAKAYKIGYN